MAEEIDNWENEGGSSEPLPNPYDILTNCYDSLEFKLSAECMDLTPDEWIRLINYKCGEGKIEEYIKTGISYFSITVKTEEPIATIIVKFYKEKNLEEDVIEGFKLMKFDKYFTASQK